ncbi:MAG TPA: SRPBCC family protein [Herpetosiphonaceae bacterium]
MTRLHAEASALIAARPEEVYGIFADYRQHHPAILPKQYFPKIEVEQGGYGAGTLFTVWTRALGVERVYHMVVSEPEPGRLLMEDDQQAGVTTTFKVVPGPQGQQTEVTIATDWNAQPGIAGFVEKLITPIVMRRMYRAELQNVADYIRKLQTSSGSASQ